MTHSLPGHIGRLSLGSLNYLLDVIVFTIYAIRDITRLEKINRATFHSLTSQLIFTGIDAMPVIAVLALASGISITSQLLVFTQALHVEKQTVELLAYVVGFELGPLITAIVVLGRSGSAMVVDLGNMKLHKEIEGLIAIGININDFFIAPRMIGAAIAQLILAVYFSTIALFGGILFSGLVFSSTYFSYFGKMVLVFDPVFMVLFAIKNILFGLIIAAVSCYHGLQVGDSPTQVPQQTQRSIMNSIILIFILNGMITMAAIL